MSKINDSDKKLIKIFVSGFIGYILIVWFIVEYKILSITNSEGWLSFFGGLGGGIIAIMGVYITLSHNRYLIEESYNRQLTLMLNQITTQFWMEKATNIIPKFYVVLRKPLKIDIFAEPTKNSSSYSYILTLFTPLPQHI